MLAQRAVFYHAALLLICLSALSVEARNRRLHKAELEAMDKDELVQLVLASQGRTAHVPVQEPVYDGTNTVYWWNFTNTDCAYDDIGTKQGCDGSDLDGCKKTCLATAGCGGFNSNGWLKKTDCLSKRNTMSGSTLYVHETSPQPPPPPPAWLSFPPIWPHPASFTNGTGSLGLSPHALKWQVANTSADLQGGITRFLASTFQHREDPAEEVAGVTIQLAVANPSAVLQLESDEAYQLDVSDSTIVLSAATQFGAYHGLETLSQLIKFDFDAQAYQIKHVPWHIKDAPRFQHRELLLDSSRHFQPLQSIKNVLDSLTYAKVNVLHWHIVDSQSFPFDSPTRPLLARMGAWSPRERFTPNDVADVVEYARQRGIRVVVEIDNPGHAASWCKGYPEVCPSTECPEPLNPATNATFDLLEDLFRDITGGSRGSGLFPDNMMHLGGDEVNTDCWTKSPEIQKWLADQGMSVDEAYYYFVGRAQSIARGFGRDVVGWEEIWNHFGTNLDNSTIIQQWLPGSTVAANATSHGYRVLWSTDGVWYLDGLDVTWDTMYEQEPCTGIADQLCDTLVLGGGGEMWGETVDTSDILQTVWPRMAAIAERLWSPRAINSTTLALPRLQDFRCLLNRRGVAAAPVDNTDARTAPPGPGGCFTQ